MIRDGPRRSRIRSLPVVFSLAAATAVAGTAIGLITTRSPASQPRTSTPQLTASYAFPPQRYPNGLLITRRWTLSGRQGSQLTETITASSVTGKPLIVWFQDSIPAAITTTVHAVHFRPDTDRILHADPVVEWLLHLPAHGMVTVGYVTVVPPEGANTARLAAWAKGLDAVEEHLNTAAARHPRPAKPSAPSTAPVLSVVGDSQQTASQILTTAGFQVNVQQGSGPAQYPDGVVFSQQPGAYGTAAKGATVTIYVQASAAPIAPTTAPPAGGNGGGNGGFGGGNGGFGGGNGGGNGGGR